MTPNLKNSQSSHNLEEFQEITFYLSEKASIGLLKLEGGKYRYALVFFSSPLSAWEALRGLKERLEENYAYSCSPKKAMELLEQLRKEVSSEHR
jgi:hypothetical protein